jgi:hypothetical protein
MCARVLKARYYLDTDFLSAEKPMSSSFTWRSILVDRELLYAGMRWGTGNGDKVSIMRGNWIPGFQQGTIKPLSPIRATAKVRYLLNKEGNGWEEDTVRVFFHDELAEVILQIPINRRGGDDFISWPHDKFGHILSVLLIIWPAQLVFSQGIIRQAEVQDLAVPRRRTGRRFGRLWRLAK